MAALTRKWLYIQQDKVHISLIPFLLFMSSKSGSKRVADEQDIVERETKKRAIDDKPMENGLMKDLSSEIWNSITLTKLEIKPLYQFIRSGGNVRIANSDGYGLLYLAAKNQSAEALRILLLQPGIDVNQVHGPHAETALHAAADAGDFDAVEVLVENGSDVNVEDDAGHTPLVNSLFAKSIECTRLLIKSGARMDVQINQGYTLLHIAVMKDSPEAIEELLKNGAEIDKVNARGLSPLALAVCFGYNEPIKRLLENGADINAVSRHNMTLLHQAVMWNRFDAVKALVEGGCNLNARNAMDETPLMLAVQQRKIDLVRYLIQYGADPSLENDTPLLYAANHGYTEMCSLLINDKTSDIFLNFAADMSNRAGFPATAKMLRSRKSMQKLQEGPEAQQTQEQKNRQQQEPVSPSAGIAESDFNALINVFSDDEDDMSSAVQVPNTTSTTNGTASSQ